MSEYPRRGIIPKTIIPGTIYVNKVPVYIGDTEVGCANDVRIDIDVDYEPIYTVESQEPERFIEGNIKITGTMRRVWVNIFYLQLLGVTSDPNSFNDVKFDLCFKEEDRARSPAVYLRNCSFTSSDIRISPGGWLEEEYEFIAEEFESTEVPGWISLEEEDWGYFKLRGEIELRDPTKSDGGGYFRGPRGHIYVADPEGPQGGGYFNRLS